VSPEGVVSAFSNGVVIITAFNEGASGSTQVTIGIPPQITITSPANGATVTQGGTIPITAQITGGATVLAVSFSINGRIEFTTTTVPFIFNFTVPTGVSSFTLGASVRDVSGATASAQTVVIMAVPDPLTTVIGTVIDPSSNLVAGASINCLGVTGTTSADGSFSIPAYPRRVEVLCALRHSPQADSNLPAPQRRRRRFSPAQLTWVKSNLVRYRAAALTSGWVSSDMTLEAEHRYL
jgi:hypothetical protein